MKLSNFAMLLLFLVTVRQAEAIPAFPGAEGGGAISEGGRGGRVIPVTHLRDDGSSGSLRSCVQASGPRTCVFRVGGTINLSNTLTIRNPFITIAGQTAPGGGITLRGPNNNEKSLLITSNNAVVRYIRIRKGANPSCNPSSQCGPNIRLNKDGHTSIFDHVSLTWNEDDNYSPGPNTSISHSIVGVGFERHATGLLSISAARGVNEDIHHNLVMSNSHRNPLLRNKSSRVVNNLWYNHKRYASLVSGGSSVDFIGNIYKKGPVNNNPPKEILAFRGFSNLGAPGTPSIFLSGNKGFSQPNPVGDQFLMTAEANGEGEGTRGPMPTAWRRSAPLAVLPHPIIAEPVANIEGTILPIVGASRRLSCDGKWIGNRDSLDAKLVTQYETNTGVSSLPSSEAAYGGFPSIAGGSPCPDGDNDGMPDQYEVVKGLNPNSPADGNGIGAGGFTNLELFMGGETGGVPPPDPDPDPTTDKFKVNDRVFVTSSTINVRSTAGGTLTGTQPQNAQGVVIGGPTASPNGVIWYNINYDTGTDGWSGQDNLKLVVDSDTPPTVSITNPAAGSTVSGTSVSVTANASDNTGVAGVQFKADGVNLGTEDTSSPYSVTWDTTLVANGSRILTAIARDAVGNTTTSSPVTVTVNNASTNSFTLGEANVIGSNDTVPANEIQTRKVTLSQRATIERMTVFIETASGSIRMGIYDDTGTGGNPGALKAQSAGATTTAGFHSQNMQTPVTLDPGNYWLAFLPSTSPPTLKGLSTGGINRWQTFTFGAMPATFSTSPTSSTWRWTVFATFTPASDTTAPTVTMTAPLAGNVSGSGVTVSATASDNTGVVGVQFKLDGTVDIGAEDTTSTYSVTWDTTPVVNGPHTITAVARDSAGNRTISAGVAVTVANGLATPSGLGVVRDAP